MAQGVRQWIARLFDAGEAKTAFGRALLFERYRAPCLLCSEPTPEHCHRRLLAEYLAEQLGGIVVTHLLSERAAKPKNVKRKA